MRVSVLGSGSRGNSVLVTAGGKSLLIDAGFGARTLQRRIEDLGESPEAVAAIVITHEHGDHARGAGAFARKFGSTVASSAGTLRALAGTLAGVRTETLSSHRPSWVADFQVNSCRVNHDAAEPIAVRVASPDLRRSVGVGYDMGRPTAALKFLLQRSGCLVIEANHDEMMLRTGPYPRTVQHRIAGSGGHLSNRAAARLLTELFHPGLEHVMLAHLSDNCNDPMLASETVRSALARMGFRGGIHVAGQTKPVGPVEIRGGGLQLELEGL